MKPAELFAMLLKLLGIWLILSSLQEIPRAIYVISFNDPRINVIGRFFILFSQPAVGILSGCFLIFFTDWFVKLFAPVSDDGNSGMASQDLFAVFARTIGVWQLALGIGQLPRSLESLRPYRDDREFLSMILNSFGFAAIQIIMGLFLVFGTGWLVRTSYHVRPVQAAEPAVLSEEDDQRQTEEGGEKT